MRQQQTFLMKVIILHTLFRPNTERSSFFRLPHLITALWGRSFSTATLTDSLVHRVLFPLYRWWNSSKLNFYKRFQGHTLLGSGTKLRTQVCLKRYICVNHQNLEENGSHTVFHWIGREVLSPWQAGLDLSSYLWNGCMMMSIKHGKKRST